MIYKDKLIYYIIRLIIALITRSHERKYCDRYNYNVVVVPFTSDYYVKYSTGYSHQL